MSYRSFSEAYAGNVAALPPGGSIASWRTPAQPMPLGASSPNATGGFGLGWPRAPSSPVKSASPPPAQIIGSRRRRRSETPGGGSDDDAMDTGAGPSGGGGGAKRARREIKPLRGSTPGRTSAPDASTDVDLGKILASLPKPALLTVLTTLVERHPSLKPVIIGLLPPPSLESFHTALGEVEKRVLDSVPRGIGLRDEYVWTRMRGPLEEYVTEARHFLAVFCPTAAASDPSAPTSTDDTQHPTTTFSFLVTLTASVRRVEAVLPRGCTARQNRTDPLSAHLQPALFNHWNLFATRIAAAVNTHGRMLSAEAVRTWFRQLDDLVGHDPHADAVSQRALEALRERFVRDIGWIVGLRPVAAVSEMEL